MTDDEILGALARLPLTAPSAESSVRMRTQSHAVLASRKTRKVRKARGVLATAVEATAFAAMFLYLAGAVGEAFRLYRLMP